MQIQPINNFIYFSCVFIFLLYDEVIAANKRKGHKMEGLDAAQRNYDRQEPDYEDDDERMRREEAEDLADERRVQDWERD
jgi:hypothetical protein